MRIAVGINGSGRYLDLTGQLYAEYNNLYDDIDFDFYAATWEDEIDYSKFEWMSGYVRIKEEDSIYFDIPNSTDFIGHQPHYMFTSYRLNHLIKGTNIKYDAILQTRSDLFLTRGILDTLVNKLRDGEVTEKLIYNHSGVSSFFKNGSKQHTPYLWCNDYFWFGHPSSTEVFAMAWINFFIDSTSYFYKNQEVLIINHVWPAEFLTRNGIYITGINTTTPLLIREPFRFEGADTDSNAGWPKKHPSTEQFEKLLKEKGAKYFLNTNNKTLVDYFINTDKGSIESKVVPGHSKYVQELVKKPKNN
jgi:hypothetical protein